MKRTKPAVRSAGRPGPQRVGPGLCCEGLGTICCVPGRPALLTALIVPKDGAAVGPPRSLKDRS
jgi:hypothetical protein